MGTLSSCASMVSFPFFLSAVGVRYRSGVDPFFLLVFSDGFLSRARVHRFAFLHLGSEEFQCGDPPVDGHVHDGLRHVSFVVVDPFVFFHAWVFGRRRRFSFFVVRFRRSRVLVSHLVSYDHPFLRFPLGLVGMMDRMRSFLLPSSPFPLFPFSVSFASFRLFPTSPSSNPTRVSSPVLLLAPAVLVA